MRMPPLSHACLFLSPTAVALARSEDKKEEARGFEEAAANKQRNITIVFIGETVPRSDRSLAGGGRSRFENSIRVATES